MQYDNTYTQVASSTGVSAIMKRVYLEMTLGLLVTAFVAYFCASSPAFLNLLAQHSWMMWGLFIAELAIVIGVSGAINRLSAGMAVFLFFLFAVINGMALTPVFLVYTSTSIAKTFFITAGTFGAMSVYGFCTGRDLTRMGGLLLMALIGIIIASVVNIFIKSEGLGMIIPYIGVLIFVGLTAWDTQQIKRMAIMMPDYSVWKLATLGALTLYLDFINMFLYLLRIFGGNNND